MGIGARLAWAILAGVLYSRAHAAGPLPDLSTDQGALLESISAELVKTVGIVFDHRPYQPATPLGTAAGVDLTIEATIAKVPQSFKDTMAGAGFSGVANLPVLPSPKFHIHKGMGETVDVGGSLIIYQGYKIYGGDIKVALTDPKLEGPVVAGRLSYNYSNFSYVTANTWTSQLLMSRKMVFADPYVGVGYQYVVGKAELEIPLPDGVTPEMAELAGIQTAYGPYRSTSGAFIAFCGVSIQPPNIGLKLVMEGSYNTATAHTLGIKVGFAF
jgi:hypothetical protein